MIKMYSNDTSVLFVCRLCKASFQIVDDFIEHKKEEHSVEFRTSSCIVFEDVLILNTNNDEDDGDKKCGTLTTIEDNDRKVPLVENSNVQVVFGNENSLTGVDLDISHIINQEIPQHNDPLADLYKPFPVTKIEFEKDGNGITHQSTTSLEVDSEAYDDYFLQQNHDYQQETVESSGASTVNFCFELIKPKMELIEFKNGDGETPRTASVDVNQFQKNPYVLLEKLSSKEIQNYTTRLLQNQETTVQTKLTYKSQCRLCLKKFNSEADLQLHFRVCIHDNSSWLRYCVPCSKFFPSKRAQNMHQIIHHGANREQWNLLKFKCGVCQKPYSRKELLRSHMESHKEKNVQRTPFK